MACLNEFTDKCVLCLLGVFLGDEVEGYHLVGSVEHKAGWAEENEEKENEGVGVGREGEPFKLLSRQPLAWTHTFSQATTTMTHISFRHSHIMSWQPMRRLEKSNGGSLSNHEQQHSRTHGCWSTPTKSTRVEEMWFCK